HYLDGRSCGTHRQENAEHAAFAHHAVDLDAAAMLRDDRVADRETEPGPATRALRRVEGLEDLHPIDVANAVASVDDLGDHHSRALVGSCPQSDDSLFLHRVEGVQEQ